jgi:hypothetical protein
MRNLITLSLSLSLLLLFGCGSSSHDQDLTVRQTGPGASVAKKSEVTPALPKEKSVSLTSADSAQSATEAMNRKIIRNGELTIETPSPLDAQRRVTSIAESQGGFVVTTESKQRATNDPARFDVEVTIVIRVPSDHFGATIDEIRAAPGRVLHEKITGQDVTEEFMDLEARIKTQKALEAQFLEIMKRANKVEDAMQVQSQIADVRTEIEKLEGRRRFLENRSSLSTITITFQPPELAMTKSGFLHDIGDALHDGVSVAMTLILFLVRFVIVLIPISLVLVPIGFVARYFIRNRRAKLAP